MFERFTQKARRCVFFARYEASTLGAAEISTEHLLVGILREDKPLFQRFLRGSVTAQTLSEQIRRELPTAQGKTSTSLDMPVSFAVKRVFTKASEESAALNHEHLGPEHLLMGICHAEKSAAAAILRGNGITLGKLREYAASLPVEPPSTEDEPVETARSQLHLEGFRDLTGAAEKDELTRLIGREQELGRAIQVLSRRTRNNPVLVGEPGVGKTTIVDGLARRIASGPAPESLLSCRVLSVHAASLFPPAPLPRPSAERLIKIFREAFSTSGVILCIDGLFDLALTRSDWAVVEAAHILDPYLLRGSVRCIATGTPAGLRHTLERAGIMARHFEVINVAAMSDDEAIQVLAGIKAQYEKFHGVVYGESAIEAAVYASGRFLAHRCLPERAVDLIDEAGARVKARRETEPGEIAEASKRLRHLQEQIDRAIENSEFERARDYAETERRERETLRLLRQRYQVDNPPPATITPADIEQLVAERAGVPVSAVKNTLKMKASGEADRIIRDLTRLLPVDANEWVSMLAAWAADASPQEVDKLAEALRQAKANTERWFTAGEN